MIDDRFVVVFHPELGSEVVVLHAYVVEVIRGDFLMDLQSAFAYEKQSATRNDLNSSNNCPKNEIEFLCRTNYQTASISDNVL